MRINNMRTKITPFILSGAFILSGIALSACSTGTHTYAGINDCYYVGDSRVSYSCMIDNNGHRHKPPKYKKHKKHKKDKYYKAHEKRHKKYYKKHKKHHHDDD